MRSTKRVKRSRVDDSGRFAYKLKLNFMRNKISNTKQLSMSFAANVSLRFMIVYKQTFHIALHNL